jgi:hypothetical protein
MDHSEKIFDGAGDTEGDKLIFNIRLVFFSLLDFFQNH